MKRIYIVGAGGFARELAFIVKDFINFYHNEYVLAGFIDDNPLLHGKVFGGYEVFGDVSWFKKHGGDGDFYVCGIGDTRVRMKKALEMKDYGVKPVSIIHSSCVIDADSVSIGDGTVVAPGCVITNDVVIGNDCYINMGCTIGHDVKIDDYVNIGHGSHISGHCTLFRGCHLGTGTVVIPSKSIGEWSYIGAGGVVIKDVPPNVLVCGVPGVIKKRYNNDVVK